MALEIAGVDVNGLGPCYDPELLLRVLGGIAAPGLNGPYLVAISLARPC